MQVFRRRSTIGHCALLAFALQAVLALAQTHTHFYGSAVAGDLAKRAITYGMCRATAERSCPTPAPHNDETNCPICWSTGPANAGLLQAPPVVALPAIHSEPSRPLRSIARLRGDQPVHFRARAPPFFLAA